MKQYQLTIWQPVGPAPSPEAMEPIMRDLNTLNEDMRAAGVWVFGNGFHQPDSSTVVRSRDGETVMTDGPYVEGKEFIGGITIINAPDLDAALTWGERLAGATTLPVEVKPFTGEA